MALPAALILSGLPQEQFTGDLEMVFTPGTVLLKSPELSPILSRRSFSSTSSSESGISSLPSESEKNLDYYLGVINKLETNFGRDILEDDDDDSGQQSDLEETTASILDSSLERFCGFPFPLKYKKMKKKVRYQNRDLLDMGSNLSTGWECTAAVLQKGINNFFQNRSQMSRLDGANIPPHTMVSCDYPDCNFEEPVFM